MKQEKKGYDGETIGEMNTRTVIDIKKVQHASFIYRNQSGLIADTMPKSPSVNGEHIEPNLVAGYHMEYPGETMVERALRLGIIDRWTPVVVFTFAANHNVTYTGKKATDMWKAWNKYIFKDKK